VGETLGTYSWDGDVCQIVECLTGALPSTVAVTTQQVRSPRPRPCPDLALRQPLGQWAHEPSTMQPNRPPHRETVSVREDVSPVDAVFPGIQSGGREIGRAHV